MSMELGIRLINTIVYSTSINEGDVGQNDNIAIA